MADTFPIIELDYKQLKKELEEFNQQMPNSAKTLMAAVNKEVVKQFKIQARARGYSSHKSKPWGDAGYQRNIQQFSFKDYTGRIFIDSKAFHYRFIEYGARVHPRGKYLTFKVNGEWKKSRGFILPARPILHPIANSIWGTNKANQIMEQKLQQIMDKQFSKK